MSLQLDVILLLLKSSLYFLRLTLNCKAFYCVYKHHENSIVGTIAVNLAGSLAATKVALRADIVGLDLPVKRSVGVELRTQNRG